SAATCRCRPSRPTGSSTRASAAPSTTTSAANAPPSSRRSKASNSTRRLEKKTRRRPSEARPVSVRTLRSNVRERRSVTAPPSLPPHQHAEEEDHEEDDIGGDVHPAELQSLPAAIVDDEESHPVDRGGEHRGPECDPERSQEAHSAPLTRR